MKHRNDDGLVVCIVLALFLFFMVLIITLGESGVLFELTCRIFFKDYC